MNSATCECLASANELLAAHSALVSRIRATQKHHRRQLRALSSPPFDILKSPLILRLHLHRRYHRLLPLNFPRNLVSFVRIYHRRRRRVPHVTKITFRRRRLSGMTTRSDT
ncbi:uncharacterized protein B0H18DRAFT_213169 [Fomitopsis serialis]|uniref:uncharacterized protein n=1 Tax=Fomitopsis serialis TaxID=139415 RepID=UPI0020089DE5|nr:uncharacterized protein B0H18DRAFT_213169 [Neoantrodia serialis]KAH9929469.1 hypothetical protein B0H18DRAFT_213169 [Neoantrodia serialis]